MIQLPEEFDSIFRYIVVVSQRAEQIINGAKPRTESRHAKQTLKARDDVDGGAVGWRVLSQEELDAHRQAMVEQFRAEVGAVTEPEGGRPIPDVLPTAEVPAAKPDADPERDDELARLQRLLGMTGLAEAAKNIDDSEEAKKKEAKKEEAKEEEAKEGAPVDLEVEEKKKG